ncbi:MAG: ssb [Verrucomicrobiales bacterium]|nr:ssb [Verrucomicrobiales bacterium]
MASLNKVMLIGNLTRDPELRYTPKGMAVTDIGLAMNRRYVVDGEKREEVTFVDVTFWGKGAEIISQYMKKGSPIYVEGRLRLDSWEDKQSGQKQSRLKVTGEEFQFLGGREGGGGAGGGGGGEGGYERSSGGGGGSGNQSRGPSQRPQPQQSGGGGDYDAPPPRSSGGGSGSGGGGGQQRPDPFPPGLDDDEIPF